MAEVLAIEQKIQDAAHVPIKKKKRVAPKQYTGTHLANGTAGGRPRGTAVDEMRAAEKASEQTVEQPISVPAPAPEPAPVPVSAPIDPTPIELTNAPATATVATTAPKKKKKKVVVVASESDSDEHSYAPNSSDNESDYSQPRTFNTRAGALLAKRPSVVREDREREEEEDDTHRPVDGQRAPKLSAATRTVSPTPLPRSSAGKSHTRGQHSASVASAQGQSTSQFTPAPVNSDTAPITPQNKGLTTNGNGRGGRVHSVSPVRTAHFAPTPDHLAVKHQPPARSVSPRKSALKNSSSDSPRRQSPVGEAGLGHRHTNSEVSNASSVESEEQPLPRKKAVRVSFDESNVVVVQAAGQEPIAPPVTAGPQQDPRAKRGWFNIGSRGKREPTMIEDVDGKIMQPRPALPSFGSVRERKHNREPVEERPLVKPAEHVQSVDTSVATPSSPLFTTPTGDVIELPLGQSNDHAVGAIISQDAASKNAANISKSREPLPPQVTSVEGNEYHSESDSFVSQGSADKMDVGVTTASSDVSTRGLENGAIHVASEDEDKIDGSKTNGGIPEISVSSATPTLEETNKRREWPDMPVPGSWEGSTNSDSESESQDDGMATPVATPATVGIAEPLPEGAVPNPHVLNKIPENSNGHPVIMEETEESDASLYSDAAEDLSDVEGGFMSLDAVVQSPVVKEVAPGTAVTTPPESTVETREMTHENGQVGKKSSAPELSEGWEKAQQYWGSLSAEKKSQLEQQARETAAAEASGASDSTMEAPAPSPKPKKKKKATIQPDPVEIVVEPQPVEHGRTYMIQPGTRAPAGSYIPAMRTSMRPDPPSTATDIHMRKSMRAQGSVRQSWRESPETTQPRATLVKKPQPLYLPPPETRAEPAAANTHASAIAAANGDASKPAKSAKPILRRKGSGDSDSSFKRSRAAENTSFRRSMRGPADNELGGQQSPLSSRFSLRSLSPTGSTTSRRPFSAAPAVSVPQAPPQTSMRTFMRNSYNAPTLRGNRERGKSPVRIPGFGRGQSKSGTGRPVSQRASRFADSSDEEDTRPAFRSRFVDSSDDDEDVLPPHAGGGFGRGTMRAGQPVRGIPRQPGVEDGDSTDLPDSDDEKPPASPGKLSKVKQNSTTLATSNQGAALASGSLRRNGSGRNAMGSPISPTTSPDGRSGRGNLMSILRRKKPDPSSKVRKPDIESAARRDTPLERSRSDLQAMKRNGSQHSTLGSPKLQKRNNVASWPLQDPAPALINDDGRPLSVDAGDTVASAELANVNTASVSAASAAVGGETTTEPDLVTRRFTVQGLPGELNSNGTDKAAKKKKFGKLRRMFRLDD